MFAYCRNNPVRRIDVAGTDDEDCFDDETKIDLTPRFDGGSIGGSSGPESSAGTGGSWSGTGMAPKTGQPGSTYYQYSSDGKNTLVSETYYNEHGLPGYHIDYAGRDHHIGLPHMHRYSYNYYNGELHRDNEDILPWKR